MVDVHSSQQRSYNMSRIKSRNTSPELAVRRIVYALGYRYRLHCRDLIGRPDLVFRRKRKVVLVHGCFWHRHNCKQGRVTPKTREDFWKAKFAANKKRDTKVIRTLKRDGWNVLVVWECQLSDTDKLKTLLVGFLR